MKKTTGLAIIAIIVSSTFLVITQAPASLPGSRIDISEVYVDDPTNPSRLLIHGKKFLQGTSMPMVSIGDHGYLQTLGQVADDLIYAELPDAIGPGDYVITVSTGEGQSYVARYDFTLPQAGLADIKACDGNKAIQVIQPNGEVTCKAFLTSTTSDNLELESTSGKITIKVGNSTVTVDQNGTINIVASGDLNLSGKKVKINATQSIQLNGGALVDVKGSLITLN